MGAFEQLGYRLSSIRILDLRAAYRIHCSSGGPDLQTLFCVCAFAAAEYRFYVGYQIYLELGPYSARSYPIRTCGGRSFGSVEKDTREVVFKMGDYKHYCEDASTMCKKGNQAGVDCASTS